MGEWFHRLRLGFPTNPGKLRIFTPIKFNRTRLSAIIMRPARADMSSSRAAWTFLGSPEAVAIWKPAKTIIKKAMPPPIPTPQPKSWLINCFGSWAIRHPMAVLTPLFTSLSQKGLASPPAWGGGVPASAQIPNKLHSKVP